MSTNGKQSLAERLEKLRASAKSVQLSTKRATQLRDEALDKALDITLRRSDAFFNEDIDEALGGLTSLVIDWTPLGRPSIATIYAAVSVAMLGKYLIES